jgi:hypothetical protein
MSENNQANSGQSLFYNNQNNDRLMDDFVLLNPAQSAASVSQNMAESADHIGDFSINPPTTFM